MYKNHNPVESSLCPPQIVCVRSRNRTGWIGKTKFPDAYIIKRDKTFIETKPETHTETRLRSPDYFL